MIALESLKHSIIYLRKEIDTVRTGIVDERSIVSLTFDNSVLQRTKMDSDFGYFFSKRDMLLDDCSFNQHEMDDNRDALVLFCQQFAFAPDMAGPCASLITCR